MEKKLMLVLLVFYTCSFLSYSQKPLQQKFKPDEPVFFIPKTHDPNFKMAKDGSYKSFYQSKSEWQHIIDTTWGPGDSLPRKLLIYKTYAKAIHDRFDGLNSLQVDWDSLYNHYLNQINDSTSKGSFSSIMSHFAYDMKNMHVIAYDSEVVLTPPNPGVPVLLLGFYHSFEHFGAVTTILPDSTTLVLRVSPGHPLKLEPGDIILGYEGVPWKDLVKELLDAGLPMLAYTGGCKTADSYNNLLGAGLNWHLFITMDVLKYSSGDTVHLAVQPMADYKAAPMVNNEQMPLKNIPFPHVLPWPVENDTVLTYSILENTNIGYIYLAIEWPDGRADAQFFKALTDLMNTDALIIDIRLNYGGWDGLSKTNNLLFNESYKTLEYGGRCNINTFDLCSIGRSDDWKISDASKDYYDKPVAILLGPSCVSMGDMLAQRFRYHPMVRFFGVSSAGTLGESSTITNFSNWLLRYSVYDMCRSDEPGNYLNGKEFPIDFPVWFNKEDVANGIDPIVEKSLDWINNLAYGHSIIPLKTSYMAGRDTAIVNALIENPNAHSLSARLFFESLDGSSVDSIDLTEQDGKLGQAWQGRWEIPADLENTFWLSLKVTDNSDGSSFINKHATRITTIPLLLDSMPCVEVSNTKYSFKPYFKNAGTSQTISNNTVNLTCNDPWVTTSTPIKRLLPNLTPGLIKGVSSPFSLSYDTNAFPGYFNLKFSVLTDGWPLWEMDTTLSVPTGVQEAASKGFMLEQNFPNPFSNATTIAYRLQQRSPVKLSVFDVNGRLVANLVNAQKEPGLHEAEFNASALPAGVYFYQIQAGTLVQTRKMVVLK